MLDECGLRHVFKGEGGGGGGGGGGGPVLLVIKWLHSKFGSCVVALLCQDGAGSL